MTSPDPAFVDFFKNDPRDVIRRNPQGGPSLLNEIHSLAGADGETLNAIASIVPFASRVQKIAIGQGLAQARLDCRAGASPLPRRIDGLVRRLGDPDLTRAYGQADSDDEGNDALVAPSSTDDARPTGIMGPLTTPTSTKLFDPFARIK